MAVAIDQQEVTTILALLRDYQIDVTGKCREERRQGKKKIILQMETGGGKTVSAAFLIWLCWKLGKRAIFLASGRELVNKADEELWHLGVPHGIIMAYHEHDPASVYVASKDTLVARCLKRKKFPLPHADLVICDEAHVSMAGGWQELLRHYEQSGATLIGLTATPARQSGRGLGDFWETMVKAVPPSVLIERGFIVPTRVFAPYNPNLKGVKTTNGDYDKQQLACKMDRPRLVGDIVRHWKLYGENRQTLGFFVNIDHSKHVRDEFRKAGVLAEHVDGTTPIPERDKAFADFQAGVFQILCTVGVAKQGVDLPCASAIILARPTKSYVFFRQAVGRGKRPHPGKKDCLLLDHSGACYRLGMPDDDIDWSLDPGKNVNKSQAQKNAPKERKPKCCPKCFTLFREGRVCPHCSFVLTHQVNVEENKSGQLIEVTEMAKQDSELGMKKFWARCLHQQYHRGGKIVQAKIQFYNQFRKWPPENWSNVPGIGDNNRRVAEVFPDLPVRKKKGVAS